MTANTTEATRPITINLNESELTTVREIAAGSSDKPVLMMNLNLYKAETGYPHGAPYLAYRKALSAILPKVGGKILWESPTHGQMFGEQPLHEILAVWYPSHQAFLDLRTVEGAELNFRLRGEVVELTVIHRCDGETAPLGAK
jgi:uncharacterized protein (DUF1330 family)